MKLQEVMTSPVSMISPTATLRDAATVMKDRDIGILPAGDGDDIQGMITDRDIVVRAVAEGKDPDTCRVADIMSHDVVYLYQDQDIKEAAQLMETRQVRRLLVLGRDRKPVGVMSLGDIALYAGDKRLTGEVLQHVARPTNDTQPSIN